MEVMIFNGKNECIDKHNNVTEVRTLPVGGALVTYQKRCDCCLQTKCHTCQVPIGYSITVKE